MADARPFISDVGRIPKFDANWDINSIRTRWHRWKRGFEPFATGKGVVDPGQKTALLLHTAGISTQDNYLTMEIPEPGEGANVYDVTVRLLNNQFTPQVNNAFGRLQFRAMAQMPNEAVHQYITRLRQKAVICNFDNDDENIRDQVIEKCHSVLLIFFIFFVLFYYVSLRFEFRVVMSVTLCSVRLYL